MLVDGTKVGARIQRAVGRRRHKEAAVRPEDVPRHQAEQLLAQTTAVDTLLARKLHAKELAEDAAGAVLQERCAGVLYSAVPRDVQVKALPFTGRPDVPMVWCDGSLKDPNTHRKGRYKGYLLHNSPFCCCS